MLSLDDLKFIGIYDDIDSHWPYLSSLIEEALNYDDGKSSVEDAYNKCKNMQYQLWAVYAKSVPIACALTQIACYTTDKRLQIVALAGSDFEQFKHFYKQLSDWARTMGCSCTEIYGRPGWAKKLKAWNIKPLYTIYKMPLL